MPFHNPLIPTTFFLPNSTQILIKFYPSFTTVEYGQFFVSFL